MKAHSRFLVVDDDAAFRTRLVKALVVRGYDARGAGNVDEAIDVARDFRPDAAVVDLRMPGGKSGLDLVSERDTKAPAGAVAERVLYRAMSRGLSFKTTMGNVLTLTPPLITTREQMDRALDILDDCLAEEVS